VPSPPPHNLDDDDTAWANSGSSDFIEAEVEKLPLFDMSELLDANVLVGPPHLDAHGVPLFFPVPLGPSSSTTDAITSLDSNNRPYEPRLLELPPSLFEGESYSPERYSPVYSPDRTLLGNPRPHRSSLNTLFPNAGIFSDAGGVDAWMAQQK
jgi:hypothetical protein